MLLAVGLALLALMFVANMALAIYHSGVEMKLWQGPTACTGGAATTGARPTCSQQSQRCKVVRCDEVGLRVFGLSLANWNILISAALAGLAGRAVFLRR